MIEHTKERCRYKINQFSWMNHDYMMLDSVVPILLSKCAKWHKSNLFLNFYCSYVHHICFSWVLFVNEYINRIFPLCWCIKKKSTRLITNDWLIELTSLNKHKYWSSSSDHLVSPIFDTAYNRGRSTCRKYK